MNEEELEKTITIESLEELNADKIEHLEDEDINEQVEESENTSQDDLEKKPKKEKKKLFLKIKKWWNKLSKKKKIIIISASIIILIILSIVIFIIIKNSKNEEIKEEVEDVIVIKENYRYENGKLIFINDKQEEIGEYECENKDENLCYVSYFSTEDDFDNEKDILEDGSNYLKRTPIINETYVFINDFKTKDEQIKIYNIKDKKSSDETYRLVKPADSENKSFILKNNLSSYGVITLNNEIQNQIPFNYDYLGFINSNPDVYISLQNNRNLVIDKTGKTISKGITGNIKGLNKNYIKVINEKNEYSVYDYNGKEIFKNYEYIELYDEYAALINNQKMILKFYDDTKLNEEEIKLTNNNYVKTNIYDENNTIKETKESFEIVDDNNLVNIKTFNDGETNKISLNKIEALKSKAISYVSYLDGKLYFYQDQKKTEKLGIYTCSNKNKLTNINNNLENCFLAHNTIFEDNELETTTGSGLIPIINNRYVFITDQASDKNKTIVLYDLKNNKSISKYQEVNTYLYSNEEVPTHKNEGDLQIVAKNKNNQFGVIKLINNEITSHIKFEYEQIEKLGDYYSAKNEKGYLLISRKDGTKLFETPITGRIKNYNDNYVTGVENNLYYVYDHNNQKINSEGAIYIALYPTFYAAVNKDNKLGLYLYQKPAENFLTNEVQLNLNKYYGNDPLAFIINVVGKTYQVLVGTTNNNYETKASGSIPLGEE